MVHSAIFSHSGEFVAAGSYGEIRCWDVPTGKLLQVIPVVQGDSGLDLYCLAFSPDDRLIAGGSAYMVTVLNIWNWQTGAKLHTLGYDYLLQKDSNPFFAAALLQSGQLLTSMLDGLRTWQLEPLQVVAFLPYPARSGMIATMSLAADATLLLVAHEYTAYLIDMPSGRILTRYEARSDYEILSARLSPDKKWVALCSGDVFLYASLSGQFIRHFGLDEGAIAICFSPDSARLLVGFRAAAGNDRVQIWQIEPPVLLHEWYEAFSLASPECMDWSPDGKYIVVGGESGVGKEFQRHLVLRSADTGQLIREFSFSG